MRSTFFFFVHVLFGKPVPTFPEHALAHFPPVSNRTCNVMAALGTASRVYLPDLQRFHRAERGQARVPVPSTSSMQCRP